MRCPYCRSKRLKVVYTEDILGKAKARRRMCRTCKRTFPTLESIIEEKDAIDKYPQEVLPFKPKGKG